ncbi:hypothetical protein ACIP97_08150 [Peribacillus frigoritolerans]|uniref:hypothetical protein n=1 Tax=Peribacillus frigoritolerans TaxID=450367 RepID=UPI00381F907F
MNLSNDFLGRHNPFCGHSSSSHDKSSCCDKAKDKGHKQKRSSPIGQACQTRQQISEFLRTSIIGSIIGFTTTAEPFTPIFVELRSFDAVTGQVIVTDRAMSNFTISLSSICSVKTICPATTQPMFNA